MFQRAVDTFGDRNEYAFQIARTLHALRNVQEKLGKRAEVACTSQIFDECMVLVGMKYKRGVVFSELRDLIRNNWD